VIRPAQPGDVPTILALIGELAAFEREPESAMATEGDLHTALFGPNPAAFAHIATSEDHSVIAGFALWFLNFSTWTGKHGIYLEDLYVRPEFRREGHGRALLRELGRIATDRDYARFEWSVLDWNTPAHAFYRSLGATQNHEWTTWRLAGPALAALASSTGQDDH
jgi:ribosomal protein S18 acetylase RimI-like enzyme